MKTERVRTLLCFLPAAVFFLSSAIFAQSDSTDNSTNVGYFQLDSMRNAAVQEIAGFDKKIRQCEATIAQSEAIITLAVQKGNARAEQVAREASANAHEAKAKNEAHKSAAEAAKARAEEGLRNLCGNAREIRQRLAAGLPGMIAAVKKTETLVNAANNDITSDNAEMVKVSVEAAKAGVLDFVKSYVTTAKAIRAQADELKVLKLRLATRKKLVIALDKVIFSAEDIYKDYQEGKTTGNNLQKHMKNAYDCLIEADRLYVESGMAKECLDEIADNSKYVGVFWKYTIQALEFTIDFGVPFGKRWNSDNERTEELNSLNIMLAQCKRVEGMIAVIDKNNELYCK